MGQVLSTPRKYQCINRAAPYESYQFPLMQHYFKTIDCMAAYSNTLGVIPANEVINSQPSTIAAPVVRAVTRDVKRYMALAHGISGQRQLPVGYSSADVIMYLRQSFDYFTAGDPDEALDFFCVSLGWIALHSTADKLQILVQLLQLVGQSLHVHLRLR